VAPQASNKALVAFAFSSAQTADIMDIYDAGGILSLGVAANGTVNLNTLNVPAGEIADSAGDIIAHTGFYVNNGTTYTGQSVTVNFPGGFTISSITYHNLVYVGGILVGYN
jgi:hypothetical protein